MRMCRLIPAVAAGGVPGSDRWVTAVVRPGEHPVRALDVALLPELPHQVVARLTGTEPLLVQLSRSPAGQLTGRLPGRTSTPRCSVPDLDGDGPCRRTGPQKGPMRNAPRIDFRCVRREQYKVSEGNNTKFQRKPIKGVYLHEDSWVRNLIPQR
jgi:hypothetical protein